MGARRICSCRSCCAAAVCGTAAQPLRRRRRSFPARSRARLGLSCCCTVCPNALVPARRRVPALPRCLAGGPGLPGAAAAIMAARPWPWRARHLNNACLSLWQHARTLLLCTAVCMHLCTLYAYLCTTRPTRLPLRDPVTPLLPTLTPCLPRPMSAGPPSQPATARLSACARGIARAMRTVHAQPTQLSVL